MNTRGTFQNDLIRCNEHSIDEIRRIFHICFAI